MAMFRPFKEDRRALPLLAPFSPPGDRWCDVLGFVPAGSLSVLKNRDCPQQSRVLFIWCRIETALIKVEFCSSGAPKAWKAPKLLIIFNIDLQEDPCEVTQLLWGWASQVSRLSWSIIKIQSASFRSAWPLKPLGIATISSLDNKTTPPPPSPWPPAMRLDNGSTERWYQPGQGERVLWSSDSIK